ncbi:hypothetical protein PVW48_00010 [Dinoroseobacter sp. PD6]|nr:hypothetical protein [Dinoroseobacter sp. PD6]MDD9715118.1 hypothetical protein [Dinoroseobacter sp. PD6]
MPVQSGAVLPGHAAGLALAHQDIDAVADDAGDHGSGSVSV